MTRTEQQKFKAQGSDQRFLSAHAAISAFKLQPHLIRRPTLRRLRAVAHQVWADATVAAWGTGRQASLWPSGLYVSVPQRGQAQADPSGTPGGLLPAQFGAPPGTF